MRVPNEWLTQNTQLGHAYHLSYYLHLNPGLLPNLAKLGVVECLSLEADAQMVGPVELTRTKLKGLAEGWMALEERLGSP